MFSRHVVILYQTHTRKLNFRVSDKIFNCVKIYEGNFVIKKANF